MDERINETDRAETRRDGSWRKETCEGIKKEEKKIKGARRKENGIGNEMMKLISLSLSIHPSIHTCMHACIPYPRFGI